MSVPVLTVEGFVVIAVALLLTPERLSLGLHVHVTVFPKLTDPGEQDTVAVGFVLSILTLLMLVLFTFPFLSLALILILYIPSGKLLVFIVIFQ